MKKIIYLFGAGASREVLPIVTEIPERLNNLIEKLELEEYQLSDTDTFSLGDNKRSYQEVLINDLKWLKSESATHASIDTFAKKLYIKQKHNDLYKLKLTLTAFFIFEQLGKRADLRYDTFYASILRHHSLAFPTNINILSWNYDYQFELSYAEYRENDTIAESALNITSKFSNKDLYDKIGFSIYKLNGSTSFNFEQGFNTNWYFTIDLKKEFSKETIDTVVYKYSLAKNYPENLTPQLSFAWEKENKGENIIKQAIEGTKDAVVLVVIGYSFPFFNRDVDREIIGSMTNLEKVYFQAPDADILKERFEAISDRSSSMKLVSRFDVGQFLLPNEL